MSLPLDLQPESHTNPTTVSRVYSSYTVDTLPTHLRCNVVQSHGTPSAPEDRRYSFEHYRGSNKQHPEGDVNPATRLRHTTDPTWGPEDPPQIRTVSIFLVSCYVT